MHVKVIKGKKYWYTSKRVDGKVTSVYIGPVEKEQEVEPVEEGPSEEEEVEEETETAEEVFYFG